MIQKASINGATVQSILNQFHIASNNLHVNHVVEQLKNCRTKALGYHLYKCTDDSCLKYKYQYHSCRNRHCPQCGSLQKDQWIEDRMTELLPINYYHVVFTLPHELNSINLGHRSILFNLLFNAASQTLLEFAKTPKHLGAIPGILAILHTWGQQLSFHPHVHCIVSGGGILKAEDQFHWRNASRNKDDFLFPVKAMAIVFRGKYLHGLKKLLVESTISSPPGLDTKELFNLLYSKDWVVYAKKPFGGPQQVIEYLGRYTHKVAISNHRINSINSANKTVTFEYKDYSDQNQIKQMTLHADEFIRRFEQHILPKHFTKIRSYGYLSNRNRKSNIALILISLQLPLHPDKVKTPWNVRLAEKHKIDYSLCPHCKQSTLVLLVIQYKNGKFSDA